jgi:ATP-dependent RNA helicase DHX29
MKNLVLSSWGDESMLSENYVNPHYTFECYQSYSERTNQNLVSLCSGQFNCTFFLNVSVLTEDIRLQTQKRLNEDVIDFDLLEDLICYIDENCPSGAVLVFLPVSLRHSVSLMICFQIHRFLISYHMEHPIVIDGTTGSCRD